MTNRKRFFYNGTILTLVGLSVKTVSLLFGAFVSRTVGAEGTGLYTLVMTVYSFLITFATSGISLTVTRLVAAAIGEGKRENVGKLMRGSVVYALGFSIAATLVLFLGAGLFGECILADERSVLSLKILSASLVPTAMSAVFSGYFVGIKKVSTNAFVQVATQFFKVIITVILVIKLTPYGTKMAVAGLCIGITLGELLSFLLMLLQFAVERARSRTKQSGGVSLQPVLEMALPLAFSAYIRSGLLTLEHMLIPKQLSKYGEDKEEALASYGTLHGMSLPLVLYPMSPLSSFSGLLVPEFAESMAAGNRERMSRITASTIETTLTYAAAVSVFLYLFSEELGYIIYSSFTAGRYIALIAPVVPIMYLDHVTDSMLKGIGEQVYSMWVNISDSCLSIFLVWLLIPKMGIAGYAVVIIVMEAYNFILSIFRLKSKVKFTFSLYRSLVVPTLAAAVAALLSKKLFIMNGSVTTAYWLIVKMIFAVCIFLSLVLTERLLSAAAARKRELKA